MTQPARETLFAVLFLLCVALLTVWLTAMGWGIPQ
jgi:ABC-type transporter Mla subunit MlaD